MGLSNFAFCYNFQRPLSTLEAMATLIDCACVCVCVCVCVEVSFLWWIAYFTAYLRDR